MTRADSAIWCRRRRRRRPARPTLRVRAETAAGMPRAVPVSTPVLKQLWWQGMGDLIEFDPVDALGAGAFGQPGERVFLIQARKGEAVLSVLVEKEQVALLATEASQFLDRLAEDFPEDPGDTF